MAGIFFDIMAAFDKAWHNGIIFKLDHYGFSPYLIRWIHCFLSNRSFKVRINESLSISHPITCGVPQGAVLSPLLFSLFINDIPNNNSTNLSYSLLFADDLAQLELYRSTSRANKRIAALLVRIQEWLDKWRLSMAVHKCNYVIFNNMHTNPIDLDLKLYGNKIERKTEVTFLGVTLDHHLTFDKHVDNIRQKSTSRLNVIKTLSHKSWGLSLTTLKQLYQSLVGSLFEYTSILQPRMSQKTSERLQTIQNAALRAMLKRPFDHKSNKHTPVSVLHYLAEMPMVSSRLNDLAQSYVFNAVRVNNPVVQRCINEYKSFVLNKTLPIQTLVDPLF